MCLRKCNLLTLVPTFSIFRISIFPHFRAIDIQALIGNVGGYIGLFLGYSFLQIPTLVAFLVTQGKGWLSHIRGRRKKTKELTVTMNQKLFESRIKSNNKRNENRNRNGVFADTKFQYVELLKRIAQLESYIYGTSK